MDIQKSYIDSSELCFNSEGFIPPVLPNFVECKKVSPYIVDVSSITDKLLFSRKRKILFKSLISLLNNLLDVNVEILRVYIGGSFVTHKKEPNDLDALIIWRPQGQVDSYQELVEFVDSRRSLFDPEINFERSNLQTHFQGLVGARELTTHVIAKWVFLNSYNRENQKPHGIVCFTYNKGE